MKTDVDTVKLNLNLRHLLSVISLKFWLYTNRIYLIPWNFPAKDCASKVYQKQKKLQRKNKKSILKLASLGTLEKKLWNILSFADNSS